MSYKEPIVLRSVNIKLKTNAILNATSSQTFQFSEDFSPT